MILAERYQVIRPLAQGGFGQTFLACDRYLPGNPYCVIKQFLPTDLTPENLETAQRLFDLEAKTLYQLGTHPNIPTLLAHFEQAGEFYLVQEYIPGSDLATELAGPLLSASSDPAVREQYTQSLLKDLLTILAFVHQHSVIHRDLKPANLIRRSTDRQLVLIDFGAVKNLEPNSANYTVAIGSPGYIAPEQQAGRPCLASDLYAAGMIALYALTGKRPQQQPVDSRTGDLQLDELGSTTVLVRFIQRLAAPHPADRFADATVALSAFSRYLSGDLAGNLSENLSGPQAATMPEEATVFPPDAFPATTLPVDRTVLTGGTDAPAFSSGVLTDKMPVSRGGVDSDTQLALSQTEIRNRQALLNKVYRFWIEGVLEHSLHGQVLLTLGLEERSQALVLPWNISYEANAEPARPLDAGTRVFDIFQQLGEGRSLLILGEPGAGKTTTLLTLARDLLSQQQIGHKTTPKMRSPQRIPAIFNLSSWTGGTIDQWLVAELNSKYQIPKSIGKSWVEQQQLLLLLDGLDEVRPDRQDSCAVAINQFHQDYGPELVVCCRMNDYDALEQKLGLQSAVYVRSLTDEQIWQYLDQAETGLTGLRSLLMRSAANQPECSAAAQADQSDQSADKPTGQDGQTLFELARLPLILNIMALTYQGLSASDIPALQQGENYSHQLFSAYIQRMFARRDVASPYTQRQTLKWLQALAKNLTNTSQTVFLIERMQVNWLTSKWQRGAYIVLVFGCYLLFATTVGWHVVSHKALPLALAIGGLLCVQIFGLYRIVPAETLRWSWKKAGRSLLIGLTVGPLTGWALKVAFVYAFSPTYCLAVPGCFQFISLIGIAFGTVLGVTYGVIRGLSGSRIATVTKPNQGIRQSAKNAILIAMVATIAPLLTSLLFESSTSTLFWAAAGLSFGLALGGGEACAKHGVLRFVLFCQGRIPWNYASFLDYAAQRIFLQKVGGGYIFIHRLLLEHFASLPPVK